LISISVNNSSIEASFVNPNSRAVGINDATVEPPLGLGYMAAVLEKHGYRSEIIDANVLGLSPEKTVDRTCPGTRLVGLYVNSFCFDSAKRIASLLRIRRPEAVIVIGGPLASASAETVLKEIRCDGIVRGEGEYAILKIMENISKGRAPFDDEVSGAVYFLEGDGLVTNAVRRIIDLDQLPFPAYHLFPPLNTYRSRSRKRPVAAMITSRGCAFSCIFCSKDVFENRVTLRSAKNVLDEIDFLVMRYGVRQIDILDDNFLQKRDRVISILDGLIERNYDLVLNLQSGVRSEMLDEEILIRMHRAGFYKLGFGIESADPSVLKICRKRLDLAKIEWAVKTAKRLGFEVYGFFIIGLPGETDVSFRKTLDFARFLDLDVANFTLAIPFVGTELYRMVAERGRFLVDTTKNIEVGFYGGRVFYEYGNNDKEDILRRFNIAYNEFYSLRKKIRIVLGAHSVSELFWMWNAALVVVRVFFGTKR
jgi:radical SAM superfamily enzyme YgiQ (UPF0313 family)